MAECATTIQVLGRVGVCHPTTMPKRYGVGVAFSFFIEAKKIVPDLVPMPGNLLGGGFRGAGSSSLSHEISGGQK